MTEKREPFLIRGHHLVRIQVLLREPDKSTSEYTTEFIRKLQNDIKKSTDDAPYARDVIGNTPSSVRRFRKADTRFLDKARTLPADHPVELFVGRDAICEGCALGAHCEEADNAIADKSAIRVFLDHANLLGLRGQVRVAREIVQTDEGRIPTKRVKTTLDVVRQVIIPRVFRTK